MAWCVRHGVRVMSQQHDGILCAPAEGRTWEELAKELTEASRQRCGFGVDVEAKVVVDQGRAAELEGWLSLVEEAEGGSTNAPTRGRKPTQMRRGRVMVAPSMLGHRVPSIQS